MAAAAAPDTHMVMPLGNHLLHAFSGSRPNDFTPINGIFGLHAPSTRNDLLIWIHGARPDANFDLARAMHTAMQHHAQLVLEVLPFNYHESPDITGLTDGTANPQADEADEAALIPQDAANGCGAHVMSLQFLNNLLTFQ